MNIREQIEEREALLLSPPYAAKSRDAIRDVEEAPDPLRTAFQRDRDRIIHSKCFRRLKHKTQVYIAPGDHYRTRMTHTLEVGQIGRTVARALRLNEDLVEAIAMGHDVDIRHLVTSVNMHCATWWGTLIIMSKACVWLKS